MYSSPTHAKSLQDLEDTFDMQKLFDAGWQHTGDGHWMAPDDDTPLTLEQAMQTGCITQADEAMVIEVDDRSEVTQ